MESKFNVQGGMTREAQMLEELFEAGVFEIRKREGEEGIYEVPYMMNDALECVLVFTGASMSGKWIEDEELREETEGILITEKERNGLIVRQGLDNTCTVWFEELFAEQKLYRFHEIGHFWEKGAEQWRRLVYIIGTMQDKYWFLGEEVCNIKERELIPLMEFTPFHRYYPAKVCIPEEYIMTEEGCRCVLRLSEEAGDRIYAAFVRLYLAFPCRILEEGLYRMLMSVRRAPLYDLICRKASEASSLYAERDYGEEHNRIRQQKRDVLERAFFQNGYEGAYPEFHRGRIWVQAAEEHPFARMEAFEEGFHIWLMVSEQPESCQGYNRGFFRGRRYRGRILEPEEFFREISSS